MIVGLLNCGNLGLAQQMCDRLSHRGTALIRSSASDEFYGGDGSSSPGDILADAELFNRDELCRALSGAGIQVSPSDNQLLSAAWRTWQQDAFARLNGSYALAIFDATDSSLVLARDPAGCRPLFYVRWEQGVAFASEYKALLALPGVTRRVNRDALQRLHSRKSLPSDTCLMAGIHQVPAGHWIRVRLPEIEPATSFWQPECDPIDVDLDTHQRRIHDAFLAVMERRTRHLDPIAISLSGGVDSIAMVAAARQLFPQKQILTFSVGDAPDDPELVWSARVAKQFEAEHHALVVGPTEVRNELTRLVWHLEDPIGRTETLLGYCLAREIGKHSSTILRGDAADGLFGGMKRHKIVALAARWPWLRQTLGDVYSFTQTGVRPTDWKSAQLIRCYFGHQIPPAPQVRGATPAVSLDALPNDAGDELLNRVLLGGMSVSVPTMMTKVDRTHAAFNVDVICPFVDPQLVTAALRVPSRFKHDGRTSKLVWRKAISALLPPELATRPKFPQRLRETKAFCDALASVCETIKLADGATTELFQPGEVRALLSRPRSGGWPPEHAMRIWTLVLTEIWAQLFIHGDGDPHSQREQQALANG